MPRCGNAWPSGKKTIPQLSDGPPVLFRGFGRGFLLLGQPQRPAAGAREGNSVRRRTFSECEIFSRAL